MYHYFLQQIPTKAKGRPSAAMKEAMAAYAACEEQRKVNEKSSGITRHGPGFNLFGLPYHLF